MCHFQHSELATPSSSPHPTDNTSPDLPKDVKLVMRLMRSFQPIKDILSRKLFPQDKPIRQLIHNKGLFVLYIEFVFEDCQMTGSISCFYTNFYYSRYLYHKIYRGLNSEQCNTIDFIFHSILYLTNKVRSML